MLPREAQLWQQQAAKCWPLPCAPRMALCWFRCFLHLRRGLWCLCASPFFVPPACTPPDCGLRWWSPSGHSVCVHAHSRPPAPRAPALPQASTQHSPGSTLRCKPGLACPCLPEQRPLTHPPATALLRACACLHSRTVVLCMPANRCNAAAAAAACITGRHVEQHPTHAAVVAGHQQQGPRAVPSCMPSSAAMGVSAAMMPSTRWDCCPLPQRSCRPRSCAAGAGAASGAVFWCLQWHTVTVRGVEFATNSATDPGQ